ncbi:TMEM175 family protein [Mesorhizobium sp. WSM4935]|uniref:TMEM175 family protein n=1 Tax=Mesorhizobium sp. WSM4935 TaxID=3038547 RepID=UPI00241527E3|nr:TMEM175 family protein [Mesorhizobium sp. WSM4935]MDG4879132.1 TMEM175 family protein [Mesorhizobium sp. WSM4935]
MKRPLEPSAEGRGRIVGITDGVFAIALTFIVLEIRVPSHEAVHSEGELLAAILALAPRFLTYALSFLTLTIFWFGQQAQHGLIARRTAGWRRSTCASLLLSRCCRSRPTCWPISWNSGWRCWSTG